MCTHKYHNRSGRRVIQYHHKIAKECDEDSWNIEPKRKCSYQCSGRVGVIVGWCEINGHGVLNRQWSAQTKMADGYVETDRDIRDDGSVQWWDTTGSTTLSWTQVKLTVYRTSSLYWMLINVFCWAFMQHWIGYR